VELIMADEGGAVSSMDALNLETEATRSKKELEALLRRFTADGWLGEPEKVWARGGREAS
jgi:hypothetical protein